MYSVPSTDIEEVWPDILPLVESAIPYAYGDYVADDFLKASKSAEMQCYIVAEDKIKCVVFTEYCQYPQQKVCMITLCAGHDMKDWVQYIERIATFAKKEQCQVLEIFGRAGWEKVLPDFKKTAIRLRREI